MCSEDVGLVKRRLVRIAGKAWAYDMGPRKGRLSWNKEAQLGKMEEIGSGRFPEKLGGEPTTMQAGEIVEAPGGAC